jgi:HK97 family phage prohead protease
MTDTVHVTFPGLEFRLADLTERIVEGIVVPWNETSFLTPDPAGERFHPASLNRSLKDKGDRIKLYRNHNMDTAVGKIERWKNTDAGLWAQFRVATTPPGNAAWEEISEGMLDQFSVGFRPKRETRAADGAREVLEAELHEVSITPMGAYAGARVLAHRTPDTTTPLLPPMPVVNLAPLVLPNRWQT